MALRRLLIALVGAAVVVLVVVYSCRDRGSGTAPRATTDMVLTSPAFENGGTIPVEYTADGPNGSPPLEWSGAPEGTVTYALIMDDPDAPIGSFTHWMICDVPAVATGLPPGVPTLGSLSGALHGTQGVNGFHNTGYGGPAPPKGKAHRYYFRLYALDTTLDLSPDFTKQQLRAAMKGHILAETVLMGRYGRPKK